MAVYSFVAWLATIFAYACFLAWAFLPQHVLHSIGITYYPSRYYAIALPAYFIVVYLLLGVAYIGYNMTNTLEPDDLGTIRDKSGSGNSNTVRSASQYYTKCGVKEGIPDFGDIDAVLISSIVHRR